MTVTIRRARLDDADFLHALANHADVDPYLAARRDRSRAGLVAKLERSARAPARENPTMASTCFTMEARERSK